MSVADVDHKAADSRPEKRSLLGDSPMMPPLLTLVAGLILFSLFIPNFATLRTVSGFVNAASINAIVVIGVTLLMISGEFDLSVGAMVAMGGFVFATIVLDGGSPVIAVGLALLVTAIMGSINGGLTIWTGIPSFIVTLGTRSIYRAAVWVFSGGLMLQTTEKLPLYTFFNGRLDIVNDLFSRANFRTVTLWVLILGLILQFVLIRTRYGNQVFATGGNPGAAKAQGVSTKRVKLLSFTITGMLSGLAGIMTFSQFTTVFVATGANLELTAIAAAVVGGTLLTGGVGSIIGGLIGVLLISMLRTGVVLMGLPSDNFEAIVGVAIIGAASFNAWVRGRS
ncbi:MAG: ABC transporter permease [Anaerolineae bacterium]|nr:ABC transporter permease [Anaerolineae bacterium]